MGMAERDLSTLVLTLREGDEVQAGDALFVVFRSESRGKIQLSITAPRDVEIARIRRERPA